MRKNVFIPDDWVAVLEKAARRRKTNLSRLLYEGAASLLSDSERRKLTPLKEPGRPANGAAKRRKG